MNRPARKIYTRQGDQGQTSVLSGEKVAKDDLRVRVYGAVDELQAQLGVARSLLCAPDLRPIVRAVQLDLFVACTELACTPAKLALVQRRLDSGDIVRLETWIDTLSVEYGLPSGFVMPGRDQASASLHVARSVCRRCERLLVTLQRQVGGYPQLLRYFNRLGDLLFVLAWAQELRALVELVVRGLLEAARQGEEPWDD